MKNNSTSIESVAVKYGIITALLLVLFFFLMRLMGLVHNYQLRALNFFFLAGGIIMAIRYFKKESESFTYLKGIGVGLATSAVTLLLFAIFVYLYTGFIDPEFMVAIKQHEMFGEYLNAGVVSVAIFVEGSISGLLVSYVSMQYLKGSHLKKSTTLS